MVSKTFNPDFRFGKPFAGLKRQSFIAGFASAIMWRLSILRECQGLSNKALFARWLATYVWTRICQVARLGIELPTASEGEIFLELRDIKLFCRKDAMMCELVSYMEIYLRRDYDEYGMSLLDTDAVIDVGANIGVFTIRHARAFPRVTVYSFEPNPVVFSRLLRNLQVNGLANVVPINGAVSSSSERRPFFCESNSTTSGSLLAGEGHASPSFYADTMTLDSFCNSRLITSVGLLKVDVEGGEMEVFRFAEATLKVTRRVMVECHSPALAAEVRRFLEDRGFSGTVKEDLGWSSLWHFERIG